MANNWWGGQGQGSSGSQGLYGQIGQALPQMTGQTALGGQPSMQTGQPGQTGGIEGLMGGGGNAPQSLTIKFGKSSQQNLWDLIAKMLQQQMPQAPTGTQPVNPTRTAL